MIRLSRNNGLPQKMAVPVEEISIRRSFGCNRLLHPFGSIFYEPSPLNANRFSALAFFASRFGFKNKYREFDDANFGLCCNHAFITRLQVFCHFALVIFYAQVKKRILAVPLNVITIATVVKQPWRFFMLHFVSPPNRDGTLSTRSPAAIIPRSQRKQKPRQFPGGASLILSAHSEDMTVDITLSKSSLIDQGCSATFVVIIGTFADTDLSRLNLPRQLPPRLMSRNRHVGIP